MKTTTQLIQEAIRQAGLIYTTMDTIVKKGAKGLEWQEIERAIQVLRAAEGSAKQMLTAAQNPIRKIPDRIQEETGEAFNVTELFQNANTAGQKFTKEANVIFNLGDVRESYQTGGKTQFRAVVFKSPEIDALCNSARELRNLLAVFGE